MLQACLAVGATSCLAAAQSVPLATSDAINERVGGGASSSATTAVMRTGTFKLDYLGFDVGEERFTIERIEGGGYRIHAKLTWQRGDQPDSEGVYELDGDRRLISAVYRDLDAGTESLYEIDGGTIEVTTTRDGREIGSQTYELEEGGVLAGPHYVTDFYVLAPVDVEAGERIDRPAAAFGFSGWRVVGCDLRTKGERPKWTSGQNGERFKATMYRCRIKTENQTFWTRSWLDDEGVPNRITIERTIGFVDVQLEPGQDEFRVDGYGK